MVHLLWLLLSMLLWVIFSGIQHLLRNNLPWTMKHLQHSSNWQFYNSLMLLWFFLHNHWRSIILFWITFTYLKATMAISICIGMLTLEHNFPSHFYWIHSHLTFPKSLWPFCPISQDAWIEDAHVVQDLLMAPTKYIPSR